jgi:hypothetical protein
MPLGLNSLELQRLYKNEFDDRLNTLKRLGESLKNDYKTKGIPGNIAEELADLAIQQLASYQAFLFVLEMNNAQLEFQLKPKN